MTREFSNVELAEQMRGRQAEAFVIINKVRGKRSQEPLSHFSCPHCQKWFSVSEAPLDKVEWACSWCFTVSIYEVD